MVEFRTVAKASELQPGQLQRVEVDGTPMCLANVDGVIYAVAAICSHAGGPLAEGALDRDIITCPWHGAMFDVTSGEVAGPPADESVAAYDVKVEGDVVRVAMEPMSRASSSAACFRTENKQCTARPGIRGGAGRDSSRRVLAQVLRELLNDRLF